MSVVSETMSRLDTSYRLLSVTGRSGSGKSSILSTLREQYGLPFLQSVTTRAPRQGDHKGEYRYITRQEFDRMTIRNEFAWTVNVTGKSYGTLRSTVREALDGCVCALINLAPDTVPVLRGLAGDKLLSLYVTAGKKECMARMRKRGGMDEQGILARVSSEEIWEHQARTSNVPYAFISNPDGALESTVVKVALRLQGRS